MRRWILLGTVLGICLTLSTAWAEDYNPPGFRTVPPGTAPTTYQLWEFLTNANPAAPDDYTNDAGVPSVSLTGGFLEGTEHYDTYYGHSGVWGFETEMIATVPNFDELNPYKEIWLQLTYMGDSIPNLWAVPEGVLDDRVVMTLEDNTAIGDDWYQATWSAILSPNPNFEELWIRPANCTTYVDELVIDTICIPEPATICLFGIVALALLRKRKA